jgi:hypothetical protein
VAGTLTEFISGVLLYLYNRTLQQMNVFHAKLSYPNMLRFRFLQRVSLAMQKSEMSNRGSSRKRCCRTLTCTWHQTGGTTLPPNISQRWARRRSLSRVHSHRRNLLACCHYRRLAPANVAKQTSGLRCLISLRSGRALDKDGTRSPSKGAVARTEGVAMRRVMAIVAGMVVLGLMASMTVVSAERRAPKNDWGLPIATSGGNSASSAADKDGDKRIVVVSRNATETDIDNPPEGFSQGDELVVTSPLFMRGKREGRLDAHAVFTEVNLEEEILAFQVTFTATLRGGQIVSTGVAVLDEETDNSFTAAITGGTGRYDEAGGDVLVRFINDATRFTYDLEDLD